MPSKKDLIFILKVYVYKACDDSNTIQNRGRPPKNYSRAMPSQPAYNQP